MRIWIDADACPKAAKELVCKFALKRKLEVWMVAGQPQVSRRSPACVWWWWKAGWMRLTITWWSRPSRATWRSAATYRWPIG